MEQVDLTRSMQIQFGLCGGRVQHRRDSVYLQVVLEEVSAKGQWQLSL